MFTDHCVSAVASPLVAETNFRGYWNGFLDYWGTFLSQQDGVVMTALIVMAVSIFIITRGKWKH